MRWLVTFLVILGAFCSSQAEEEGPLAEFCSLPPEKGSGSDTDVLIYLYYDPATQKCFPFKYYGSGGNENRFKAEVYCMRNCSRNATIDYPYDRREACHFKKQPGECLGQYMRYYYDSVNQKCHSFFWTGCVGNGNRFLDMSSCNTTCHGITDPGDDLEEEEHDTPVALILGVVFLIIGVGLLIAVTVLAVKSKQSKSKKTSKINQKENIEMNPSED